MGDDLQSNVSMYKLQLQQVEDSLSLDQDNEDLQKLKTDLQEVIQLTLDLIGQKQTTTDGDGSGEGTSTEAAATKRAPVKHWEPGEKCLAPYSEDKMYYEATIDEILEDGSCTVTFEEYGNTDVTEVSLLKSVETESGKKRAMEGGDGTPGKPLSKKDKQALEREYKRKKSQKKAQRLKQLEEERETEKNKWLDFNSKTFSKTSKGKVKKSIFATPDAGSTGKVGVGTCGQSGRPMTKYTHQDKWRK